MCDKRDSQLYICGIAMKTNPTFLDLMRVLHDILISCYPENMSTTGGDERGFLVLHFVQKNYSGIVFFKSELINEIALHF